MWFELFTRHCSLGTTIPPIYCANIDLILVLGFASCFFFLPFRNTVFVCSLPSQELGCLHYTPALVLTLTESLISDNSSRV